MRSRSQPCDTGRSTSSFSSQGKLCHRTRQESNLPSVGLRRRTGFEDELYGHLFPGEREEDAEQLSAFLEPADTSSRIEQIGVVTPADETRGKPLCCERPAADDCRRFEPESLSRAAISAFSTCRPWIAAGSVREVCPGWSSVGCRWDDGRFGQ
jgi:hypothetical protein